MTIATDLIERLRDEGDLCKNDGADDIASLLWEAADALSQASAPSVQVVPPSANWRASQYGERWVVECHMPCINGLCAWVTVADLGQPEVEDEMFGGLDREGIAKRIAAALSATPVKASAQPAAAREFTNELGNRIKITIEGPTSTSENILTPMEASELRAALNGAAQPAIPQPAVPLSGETEAQRAEVCTAWNDLPAELAKHPDLQRLYLALGGIVQAAQPAAEPGAPSLAARDVLAERRRQVEKEGWTPEHDDEHGADDLALAAACYALPETDRQVFPRKDMRDVGRSAGESILIYDDVLCPHLWPWHGAWWKPKTRREDLVRAGALIIAEIERLDRAALATPTPPSPSDAQEQQP